MSRNKTIGTRNDDSPIDWKLAALLLLSAAISITIIAGLVWMVAQWLHLVTP